MLGEKLHNSLLSVCINLELLGTSFGFVESPSNRLEYSHVGFSVLLPYRPIDSECLKTCTICKTSWKAGCSSIHEPRGCSRIHQHFSELAISKTTKALAQSTLPVHTLLYCSWPSGCEADLLAVPEHLEGRSGLQKEGIWRLNLLVFLRTCFIIFRIQERYTGSLKLLSQIIELEMDEPIMAATSIFWFGLVQQKRPQATKTQYVSHILLKVFWAAATPKHIAFGNYTKQ